MDPGTHARSAQHRGHERADRHGPARADRHAGPPAGQAASSPQHFLDEVVEHGAEACNYLLAVDVEMNTVDGYAMSSWERGYGDFEMVPDLATLRPIPWHEKTALCLADLRWGAEEPVVASPRQILRAQLERLAERGLEAFAGTELEFIVFKRHLRGGVREGLPRPQAGQPVQRRLLAAGHGAGRAADRPHPARDDAGRARGRELQGRVQRRPARDQLPLRAGAADRRRARRSTRPARRRSPRRRSRRSRSWPSTTSARARSCHIHMSLRHGSRCSTTTGPSSASSPASSPACAS